MAAQVQAFTGYNGGWINQQWVDISTVTYTSTVASYSFATVGCGGAACIPTQLRLVTISSTEAHVEMAHWIIDSSCPSGCLRWVGDLVPDSIVRGLPQQCTFSSMTLENISIAVGNTYQTAASCKDSCGNFIDCTTLGTFTWSISNTAVATMTNYGGYSAIISGVSAGTTTLTVSNQGVTASSTITVTGGGGTPGYKCVTLGQPCQQNCTVGQAGCFSTQAECNNTCTTGGTGYSCTTTGCKQGCTIGTTGCYSDQTSCSIACSGGTGVGCIPACTSDQMCLSPIGLGCQPKLYIYGAVGLFFAIMMLKK